MVRLWRADTAKCVYEQPASVAVASTAAGGIVELAVLPDGTGLLTATQDCRLLFHRPAGAQLAVDCQLIGNNDEVTDVRFLTLPSLTLTSRAASGATSGVNDEGGEAAAAPAAPALPTHLAVSTNSDQIRIFDAVSMSCTATLVGHTNTVLALDALALPGAPGGSAGASTTLLASGSKDASVRLWSLPDARCVGAVLGVGLGRVPHAAWGREAVWMDSVHGSSCCCGLLDCPTLAWHLAPSQCCQLIPHCSLLPPADVQAWGQDMCPQSAAWHLRGAAAALWPVAAPTNC